MPTRTDALGVSIPNLPHAISVSLPTWDDNIGYEEGEKRVVDAMVNGYPRFFIHRDIKAVSAIRQFVYFPTYLYPFSWPGYVRRNSASPVKSVCYFQRPILQTHVGNL